MLSIREIVRKAEDLREQGEEAERQAQLCQAQVSSAQSKVASAQSALEAAREPDEEGNPSGDVDGAAAELRVAEQQLAASERALSAAKGRADAVRRQSLSHAQSIEQHNRIERENLEKLRKLQQAPFGDVTGELASGMAERLNEAEAARVALLESIGIDAQAEFVSAEGFGGAQGFHGGGGAFSGGFDGGAAAAPVGGALGGIGSDTFIIPGSGEGAPAGAAAVTGGDTAVSGGAAAVPGGAAADSGRPEEVFAREAAQILGNPNLTAELQGEVLSDMRAMLTDAGFSEAQALRAEAQAYRDHMKKLTFRVSEKQSMGQLYIDRITGAYRQELITRGVPDDEHMEELVSLMQAHYNGELERDLRGKPNQLYEEPNYDSIIRLSPEFVVGMANTLQTTCHFDEVKRVYERFANHVTVRDTQFRGTAQYKPNDGVYFHRENVQKGSSLHLPYQTAFHEFGHNIDFLMGNGNLISETWGGNALNRAILADFDRLQRQYGVSSGEELIRVIVAEAEDPNGNLRLLKENGIYDYHRCGNVSDILESLTDIAPFDIGHNQPGKPSYWNDTRRSAEFFAETLDSAASNPESYALMKRFFPSAVATVHQILGGEV